MSVVVSAEQLETIVNSTFDFYMDRGKVMWQNEQERPLLQDLTAMQKSFPGAKEHLVETVALEYVTRIQGFQYNDKVTYNNPGKIRLATYPYKLIHAGIGLTMHELLQNGISVSNMNNGTGERTLSGAEVVQITNVLDYKLEDMRGGMAKDMDEMLWDDGSTDPKLVPGIRSIIVDDPEAALVVGGIDQAANPLWRNIAQLGINASTPSNLNLINALRKQYRQMRRYKTPKHKIYAGSDFMDALEKELMSKGQFTQTGWSDTGSVDGSMVDPKWNKQSIVYTPTLDDLGLAKYCYFVDMDSIKLRPVEGEDMKDHTPSRPEDEYVLYRARTWVGGLTCRRRNTSAVFSVA